jgi:2-oxoacid:acceptor oxidoreductase delta subunit (pyruvate/2-ketoisovalerate family)
MDKEYKAPMGEGIYEINTGDWRTQYPEMDKTTCIECGICMIYCPVNAIKARQWAEKKVEYVIELSYCKGCGVCAFECPKNSITMKREKKR